MTDIPAPAKRFRVAAMTKFSRYGLIVTGVVVLALIAGPLWLGRAQMRLMVEICTLLTLAQMWNMLAGYAGLVSVGQQAFVGLGSYAFLAFAVFLGVPPLLAIPLAGLAAAILAIPTAALVFRLKGAYFAIGTWVAAEVYMLVFAQLSVFGGGSGMSLPIEVVRGVAQDAGTREAVTYWIALGLAVGAIALVYTLLRSRYGLALAAIRDSEPAAASLGVDTARAKYVVYVMAAFVTGLAGALVLLSNLRVSPDAAFSVMDWTAYVIFIVVIGGVGRIEGPIVGTIVFFLLRGLLSDLGSAYLIILGLIAVGVMLVAPRGLWGLAVSKFGVELFPIQRRLDTSPR
jgi:branched-chain amino acid transport system permease protein